MQVKAGQAIQAASQGLEALHALGVTAPADSPGHAPGNERGNNSTGSSQGKVLAAICADFQASTGLATELRYQAGGRLDPS